jgi:type IV secretion system protein VirB1
MSALTIQAALALSLQCAPSVDPHMIVAIGQHESGLDPLTIHDNTTGLVLHGAGAAGAAPQLIAAGHSVDLGLMQVNSMNLGLLGLSVSDAFTACRSVEAAAKLLALFSRYNTGSPQRGISNGYAAKVQARMDGVRGVAPANAADPAAAASQLTLRSQLASFTTTRQK